MKCNFSDAELTVAFKVLGSKLRVRLNKAGNIDVVNPKRTNPNEHYVLYYTPNKRYLWRRHFGWGYCHPLNMRNRNVMDTVERSYLDGTSYKYDFWNMAKHAEFDTVDEALYYFVVYMKKYRNIEL